MNVRLLRLSLVVTVVTGLAFATATPASAAGNRIFFTAGSTTEQNEADGAPADSYASIYSINPDGTGQQRLTASRGEDFFPAVSPDGTKVAFMSSRRPGECTRPPFCSSNYDIWVMDADGSNETILGETEANESDPAWSPDGTKLAYASNSDVHVLDMTNPTADPVVVSDAMAPTWTPDGRHLFFSRFGAPGESVDADIYAVNTTDYSSPQNLTDLSPLHDLRPRISPDGRFISYTNYEVGTGGSHVTIAELDCSTTCRISGDGAAFPFPGQTSSTTGGGWSPDGKRLLIMSDQDGWPPELYFASGDLLGTPSLTLITNPSAGVNNFPAAWQPFLPTSETAPPGGTVSTGDEATEFEPVQAAVTSPTGGDISIQQVPLGSDAVPGFQLFDQQLTITAPASAEDPLRFVFTLDDSVVPNDVAAGDVQVLRDGTPIADCTATSPAIDPVPCVSDRQALAGGDVQITVLSDHASRWSFGRRADSSSPQISCGAADNVWHRDNVAIPCTATDGGSGLANSADAAFSLRTSVAAGEANANASTGSRSICDEAGNCATAGPIGGNKVDRKVPTISFSGNGAYTVDQAVKVTCTALDPAPASGLVGQPCANPLVAGPAYSFGLGSRNVGPITARDVAGNTKTASTAFTVKVTAGSLCTLTKMLVQGSTKYQRLSASQRGAVDKLATAACANLDVITARLTAKQKAALITAYKNGVAALVAPGWLTAAQSAMLKGFADAL